MPHADSEALLRTAEELMTLLTKAQEITSRAPPLAKYSGALLRMRHSLSDELRRLWEQRT
jgi:hypothetical protein